MYEASKAFIELKMEKLYEMICRIRQIVIAINVM
jgi:hypothetical protein